MNKDILKLISEGRSNHKNKKFLRIFGALQWRQAFQNSETYIYSFEDKTLANLSPESESISLQLSQISNGEMKGLGTGTFVWPAAHVLSKYLEKLYYENSKQFSDKLVCDIGSGVGLTGFVAAVLGSRVVFTDQKQIIPLLEKNIENAISSNKFIQRERVYSKIYNWGDTSNFTESFDIILVSDCVLPKLYPISNLIQGVEAIMGSDTIAFFSYEHRYYPDYDPRHEFEKIANEFGLEVEVIPLDQHDPNYCAEDIEIWKVTRKNSINNKTFDNSMGSIKPESLKKNNELIFFQWGDIPEINILINNKSAKIKQDVKGSIGTYLWPSSVILSRFILREDYFEIRNMMGSKNSNLPLGINSHRPLTAIDLGAGCGLTSIALLEKNYKTISTDKNSVINILKDNLQSFIDSFHSEDTNTNLNVTEFDWNHINPSNPIFNQDKPDLVVCSDCLYSTSSIEPLLDIFENLASKRTLFLIANEVRTALDEFTYLAYKKFQDSITFKEIDVVQPDLIIMRNSDNGLVQSPPIRMMAIQIIPPSSSF